MYRGEFAQGFDGENFRQLTEGKEFYETTLPYNKIVPNRNNPSDTFWIYFNQTFEALGKSNIRKNIEGTVLVNSLSEIQSLRSISGSGGDYLSNEIYYRVAKLRSEIKPNLKSGHLHIPLTQFGSNIPAPRGNFVTKDINPKLKNLLKKCEEIITKALQ